jgi:hypothetical protein
MSYNITGWDQYKCKLAIPGGDDTPEFLMEAYGIKVVVEEDRFREDYGGSTPEGFEFRGYIEEDEWIVTEIGTWGEFSGNWMEKMRSFLRHTTGEMVAGLIWEGGDSLTVIKVNDGEIEEGPAWLRKARWQLDS